MSKLNRRSFLARTGGVLGLTTFPLTSLIPWSAFAASADPREPQAPPAPGSSLVKPEKLGEFTAKTDRTSKGFAALPVDEKIGFAIVGLGHLSLEQILPAFSHSALAKPVALVSGDAEKAKRVAAEYGIKASSLYSYQNFERMKENKDIQVVYIVLPNSMHKEFTLRAAAIGKHVLCEKPMSVSSADAEAMIAGCKKADRKLMIAYRQQYEPNNRRMREMVRDKAFGTLKLFEATNTQMSAGRESGSHQQWRHIKAMAGGGSLPDIGLYCLNAARFLSGEEPYEVSAFTYSTPNDPRFKEVEEAVNFQLRFPSGLLAQCACSYGAHENRRYRLSAETGWFGMDPAFPYVGLKSEVSFSDGNVEYRETPNLAEKNQFALELDHMADCVIHDKAPYTPGEEGLQDHRLMEAIYEAAATNKIVKVARIEKLDSFRNLSSLS